MATHADARAFAQAGAASPFRSTDPETRAMATLAMIAQRTREVASIEAALLGAKGRTRAALRLRLAASKASLGSWEAYEGIDSPREIQAVMTPVVRPNPLVIA